MAGKEPTTQTLKGWQAIANYMGQTPAVVERWARQSGLPVSRQGRSIVASPEALNEWLGKQSGEPVRVASESENLVADLKRGLSYVRNREAKRK